MSRPPSVVRPAVGRVTPESKLNSVVLPAPFGPMTTRNSPSRTSSETSSTIETPPILRLKPWTDSTGGAPIMGLFECRNGRRDGRGIERTKELRLGAAELRDVHRLQHRVVLCPDRFGAFRRVERPAGECRNH